MQPATAVYSGRAEDGWIVWCKSLFCSCVPANTQQGNADCTPSTLDRIQNHFRSVCCFVPQQSVTVRDSSEAWITHRGIITTEEAQRREAVFVIGVVFIVWTGRKSMLGISWRSDGFRYEVQWWTLPRCVDEEAYFSSRREWEAESSLLSVYSLTPHSVVATEKNSLVSGRNMSVKNPPGLCLWGDDCVEWLFRLTVCKFCYKTQQKIDVLWEHGRCCLHC